MIKAPLKSPELLSRISAKRLTSRFVNGLEWLLRDPKSDWPHPMLLTNSNRSYGSDADNIPTSGLDHPSGIPWYVMLRQKNYKYGRALIPGALEELYDLASDPDELTNLAAAPEHKKTLRGLREAALAELRRTGAGYADKLPPVKE